MTADESGDANRILKEMSAEDMREFLRGIMRWNKSIRKRLLVRFGSPGASGSRDYRSEINKAYADAYADMKMDRIETHTGQFMAAAKKSEKAGDTAEAARAYAGIAMGIADNIDMIMAHGSSDDLRHLGNAVDRAASCMVRQGLDHQHKRPYISWLVGMLVRDEDDTYAGGACRRALGEVCTEREDYEYWNQLLVRAARDKNHDYDNDYWRQYIEQMRIGALEGMGEESALVKIFEKHYRTDEDTCIRYVNHLRGSDPEAAKRIAKKGLDRFRSLVMIDAVLGLFEVTDPYHHRLAYETFMATNKWKYYMMYKESSKDWRKDLKSMIEKMTDYGLHDMVAGIMVREDRYDEAMRVLAGHGSIGALEQYHDIMCPTYPKQYYDAYKRILGSTDIYASRRGYAEFAKHLEKMKSVPGHEGDFAVFVESLRQAHKRRPAFLDEIKDI